MNVKARTEFSAAIAELFQRAGAINVDISGDGIATHWRTEREADNCLGRFREMDLRDPEKFSDNGLFAVYARFPK
jgi:hypothetical protein